MNYQPTIGLEIHIELKTKTKMFCDCLNVSFRETAEQRRIDAESRGKIETSPNTNICPICLGHPGTLPVINKKAVEAVLKLGLALNSEIPKISKFDRKNYFYPDLPKGYQISQYDKPLALGGALGFRIQNSPKENKFPTGQAEFRIKIRRIHLEEDTGRLVHNANLAEKRRLNAEERGNDFLRSSASVLRDSATLVDFNRAGVPLMELVTEPDIKSGKEAVAFAKELQLILRYLGISDADMEKGQMRVEANISLCEIADQYGFQQINADNISINQPKNQYKSASLGTKVEIKNLNSFRAVQDAIDYEIKRQKEILESGKRVVHETRGWDENKKVTVSQRAKEEAHDYRYFPEPDLPILRIGNPKSKIQNPNIQNSNFIDLEKLKKEIPELPWQKRERFQKEYNLTPEQIEILIEDLKLAGYFEESVSELAKELSKEKNIQTLYNYLISDIKGLLNERGISIEKLNIAPENFADLIVLIIEGKISSRIAKDLIKEMSQTGLDPRYIIQYKEMSQISDKELIKNVIKEVIAKNSKAIEDYKKGKENALQYIVGQIMRELKGRGNPEVLIKEIKESLDKMK